MMPTWWGIAVFLAIFGVLAAASIAREREVSADGEIGRGPLGTMGRARWLVVALLFLLVLVAAIVALRFQQIAIWE